MFKEKTDNTSLKGGIYEGTNALVKVFGVLQGCFKGSGGYCERPEARYLWSWNGGEAGSAYFFMYIFI